MKRVILLGDSIRQGYESTVRVELAESAYVWSPGENGQHSVNLLLRFYEWVVAQQPDLVHVNAGLWDMRGVVRGEPGNVVEPDAYGRNVARLIQLVQRHTKAKVIWATTTPVDQKRMTTTHLRQGMAGRSAADVEVYNRIAMAAARENGAAINDLHGVVIQAGLDKMISDEGVHFTASGSETLGRAVAAAIRAAL